MSKVLVLIIKTEPGSTDDNIQNLKTVFSDSFFNVNVISVTPPTVMNKTKELSNYDIITLNRIKKALTYANKNSINLPILVVLDTSSTYETTTSMKAKIEKAIELDYDIIYLCKWYDDCQSIQKTNVQNVYSTKKPKGFQSAIFSQRLKDIIMTEEFNTSISFAKNIEQFIQSGKIKAFTYIPNIINFDIDYAKTDDEYLKLNEFAPIINKSPNEGVAYIWFIFLIILIILVAWAVLKLGPDEEKKKEII